jgi:hypothetical protein
MAALSATKRLAVLLESPPFNSNASYNVLFKAHPVRDRRRNPQS